jgi:Tol biopolymer transport system component
MTAIRSFLSKSPAVWGLIAVLALLLGLPTALMLAFRSSSEHFIVFTSDRDGNLEIYAATADGRKQTNLTNSPRDEFAPVLSPDRRQIAFLSGSEAALEVMKADGTVRTRVTLHSGAHRSHRWSPTSQRLAYIVENGAGPLMYVAHTDGSRPARVTDVPGDEVGAWSHNGEVVAFAVRQGDWQGIWTRNPDGVNELRITRTPDYSPIWSPDSSKLAFLSTRDGNPELYVMDADGSDQLRLTETDAPEYQVSWSPDGRRLLFVSERDGNPEIYVTDLDGFNQRRLTFNSARDDQPVWSPDGKRIAFVSYLDGDAEIYVMAADGSNQSRVTSNTAQDTSPSW